MQVNNRFQLSFYTYKLNNKTKITILVQAECVRTNVVRALADVLVRAECMHTNVVRLLADLVATKLALLLRT